MNMNQIDLPLVLDVLKAGDKNTVLSLHEREKDVLAITSLMQTPWEGRARLLHTGPESTAASHDSA